MKKYAVCLYCGHKLLKAEPGSVVEMVCPSCKTPLEVVVKEDIVMTKDRVQKKAVV